MSRNRLLYLFVALLPALPLTAQVAYPEDSPRTGNGNITPFGFSTGLTIDEGRYQLLVPARYLPSTGGLITGLSTFSIPGPSQLTYASLTITMSNTVQASLSPTFASNLPAPAQVFLGVDVTLPFAQSAWSPPIPFQVPFFYDGVSDLVIDIQKVYDRTRHPSTSALMSSGTSQRNDLPASRYEFGTFGSGAAQSPTARFASTPLKIRLEFAGLPTLRVRSDPSGSQGNIFALGGNFTLTMAGAAGTPFVNLIWIGFNAAPVSLPGIGGAAWLPLGIAITMNSGTIGANGQEVLPLVVPNDPTIVGLQPTFQGAVVTNGQLSWTNACDGIVNS